jgi:hypothetical protein
MFKIFIEIFYLILGFNKTYEKYIKIITFTGVPYPKYH